MIWDVKNISLILVGIVNLFYGFLIYSRNRKSKTNLWFLLVVLGVTFWIVSMIFYRGLVDENSAVLLSRILYVAAASIPFFFLYFTFVFPKEESQFKSWQKYFIPVPFLIISFLAIAPDFLIKGVNVISGKENFIIFDQKVHLLYGLYIAGYFGWGYINLIKKYFSAEGVVRKQLIYVIIGTFISTMIGMGTNLILPFLGVFSLNWMGQATVIFMIGSIFYAILKHHLFDVKVIATEFLVFAIWVFLIIRALISSTRQDSIMNWGLLALMVIFGAFLIRSVAREVEVREEIEKLSQYKSDLISIVAHQLKNPLVVIKGYSSLIEDKTITDPKIFDEIIDKMRSSTNKLIDLLNNLLDLGHIEDGKMHYEFEPIDINKMLSEIVGDFKLVAQQKKLELTYEAPPVEIKVKADPYKLSQVFRNLIDNSIKYTPTGFVKIKCDDLAAEGKVLITIKDSGLGISADLIPKLFQRFSRGVEEKQILGTGLGLYISRQIIEDHQGLVWVESEGEGKGSQFYVKLSKDFISPIEKQKEIKKFVKSF